MSKLERDMIIDLLEDDTEMMLIGGPVAEQEEFMTCAVGIVSSAGDSDRMCYDSDKCVQLLMDRDGMSEEEASEYFSFNILGAYVGKGTPVFLWRREIEQGVENAE
jgi:hypothetical protein